LRERQLKTEKFSCTLTEIKTAQEIQGACSNSGEHSRRPCPQLTKSLIVLDLHPAL